eukprot:GDKK01037567.1.p1 GENE.GDKK01037567.1~~GDKK01037567.1.p1  ORF type:complete len:1425 (-),score=384.28 GDKK01037567.1:57-4331(-)
MTEMDPPSKLPRNEAVDASIDVDINNNAVDDGFSTEVTVKQQVKSEFKPVVSSTGDFFDFYYIDGYEDAEQSKAFLFGKTKVGNTYQSASVVFEKMSRNLLIIPAPPSHSTDADALYTSCSLQAEDEINSDPANQQLSEAQRATKINDLCKSKEQSELMSHVREEISQVIRCNSSDIRMKWVTRSYAFERAGMARSNNIQCLKVLIPYSHRTTIPPEMCNHGGKYFSHVFNARQSVLETLILKKRITGPCWLRIFNGFKIVPESEKRSWCDVEVSCNNQKNVRVWGAKRGRKEMKKTQNENKQISAYFEDGDCPSEPPLKVMALNMKTKKIATNNSNNNSIPQLEPMIIAGAMLDWQIGLPLPLLQRSRSFVLARGTPQLVLPPDLEIATKSDTLQQCGEGKGIETFRSESDLLEAFVAKLAAEDPDVIISHNAFKGELELLRSRFVALRIRHWSRVSRMKRSNADLTNLLGKPGNDKWTGRLLTVGRLTVDTMDMAQELERGQLSYDLTTLTNNVLNRNLPAGATPRKRDNFDSENLEKYYRTGRLLLVACKHALTDCSLSLRLAEKIGALPLSKELTVIAGNLWYRSLQGARAERNEWLLLHEFWRKKFIVPDKKELASAAGKSKQQAAIDERIAADFADADDLAEGGEQTAAGGNFQGKKKSKAAYLGGLVLEPKAGLYTSYILLLDFNSLYPSIIQEFNLCFTTVDRPDECQLELQEEFEADLPGSTDATGAVRSQGILPFVLESLVRRRRDVKKLMAEAEKKGDRALKDSYNTRQTALKLTANSMYGCLGFTHSRFYCRPLAALVTRQGRKILQNAKNKAETELGLEVVYGDTDSIMIDTRVPAEFTNNNPDAMIASTNNRNNQDISWRSNFERAWSLGLKVKASVNELYTKLELDIDGVFGRLLLLKKKKYAAVTVEVSPGAPKPKFKEEFKGLDMVRRDWCPLSKTVSEQIIRRLLSHEATANVDDAVEWTHQYLREVAARLDAEKWSLEELCITKSLTKPPNMYSDAGAQPHVQVALRLQSRTGRQVKAGDLVPYIITLPKAIKTEEGAEASIVAAAVPVSSSIATRAFAPDELRADEELKPDIPWYKSNQLLAPIARVLQPLQQTSQAQLAECLGLDSSKFHTAAFSYEGGKNNEGRGWDDLSCLPIHEVLKSKERFRNLTLPSVPCPSVDCARGRGRILLVDLLKGGSCRINQRLLAEKSLELQAKGCGVKAAFRCTHCHFALPSQWVKIQIRLALTNWLRSAERDHKCVECDVATSRTTLIRGHRCPQPACFEGHAKSASIGGNELKAVLTRHRFDLYLEYMISLLDENMYDPELEKDDFASVLNNANSKPDLAAKVEDIENAEPKEENVKSENKENVNSLGRKFKETSENQQHLKELQNVRNECKKIIVEFKKHSAYQKLDLRALFAACVKE